MTVPFGTPVRDFVDENFERPETIEAVEAIIQQALQLPGAHKGKVRVRGSEHSVRKAVYTDPPFDPLAGPTPTPQVRNVLLDRLVGTPRTDVGGEIAFLAGHHLGGDPGAHGPSKDFDQSVCGHLERRGWALHSLGGISHQSIAGFLATGSSGGSTTYDLVDSIRWLKVVDGTGAKARVIRRDDPDFKGLLTSMGLLGIIVEVGLGTPDPSRPESLPATYDVKMAVDTVDIAEDGTVDLGDRTLNLFEDDGSLVEFFEKTEYARMMWWPQPGVNRLQVWTGTRDPVRGPRKPYIDLPLWQQILAAWIYRHILDAPSLRAFTRNTLAKQPVGAADFKALRKVVVDLAGKSPRPPSIRESDADAERVLTAGAIALERELKRRLALQTAGAERRKSVGPGRPGGRPLTPRELLVACIIKVFITPESDHTLRDIWHDALPHDNQMNDDVMTVIFTEMWLDLDEAPRALRALQDLFDEGGVETTGTMCLEVYASKPRDAWLSPSGDKKVIRIDPFVFRVAEDTEAKSMPFFETHWEALRKLGFRFHWGKVLSPPQSLTGVDYRNEQFPDLAKFKALRQQYDPHDLFLTAYWKDHLGL